MAIEKTNIKEKQLLISPFEAKHFILDIPKLKPAYQKQAVQFALKSLYPGTDKDTSIDYSYNNKKVIGIATNKTKLEQYKTQYSQIISPTLILQHSFQNGVCVLISNEWTELQMIKDGNCLKITDCFTKNTELIVKKIKELANQEDKDFPVILIYKDYSDKTLKNLLQNDIFNLQEKDFYRIATPKLLKTAEIFSNKPQKNNINIFYPILSCVLVALLIYSASLSKTEKKYQLLANEKKQEYQQAKQKLITQNNNTEQTQIEIEKKQSLYSIFEELYKANPAITIHTFSTSDNTFRFEAENANALDVLAKLQNSDILYEVNLLQSTPQQNGKEKFIISGKIK